MINKILYTKFGTAKINNYGYYQITNNKENNMGKYLHRLIFEDYHNCKLDENDVIHHIDGDKLNNHPANLICMSRKAHRLLHAKGKSFSDEHKKNLSESHKDKTLSEEHKIKTSESMNTTGYFRVTKHKDNSCKQGFTWCYQYYENGKHKNITSVDISKLEAKVKAKGLKWKKLKGGD